MQNKKIRKGLNVLFISEIAMVVASFFWEFNLATAIIAAVIILAATLAQIFALKELSTEGRNYSTAFLMTFVALVVFVVITVIEAIKGETSTGGLDVTSLINLVINYSVITGTCEHLTDESLKRLGKKAVIFSAISFIALTAVSAALGNLTGNGTVAEGITVLSGTGIALISAGIGLVGDIFYLLFLNSARNKF